MILDLYRNPLHKGLLAGATHSHKGLNPTCGDEITIYAIVNDDVIQEVTYTGDGCAISQAAVSLVADTVVGMNVTEIETLGQAYVNDLLGVDITPTRVKCALLGLQTLQKAVHID